MNNKLHKRQEQRKRNKEYMLLYSWSHPSQTLLESAVDDVDVLLDRCDKLIDLIRILKKRDLLLDYYYTDGIGYVCTFCDSYWVDDEVHEDDCPMNLLREILYNV